MENKSNKKDIIIAILLTIIIILILIIGYGILTQDKNNNNNLNINENTNSNELKDNEKVEEKTEEKTEGKIYITRNGKKTLESVPSDLVGTYDNGLAYFTINSDGTFYISEPNGDGYDHGGTSIYTEKNASIQITYLPYSYLDEGELLLEIYTNKNNGWLPSPFRLGVKDLNGNYSFATIEHTPTSNALEYTYKKRV